MAKEIEFNTKEQLLKTTANHKENNMAEEFNEQSLNARAEEIKEQTVNTTVEEIKEHLLRIENSKESTMPEKIKTNLNKEYIIELIKLAANYDGCASKMVEEKETIASNEEKQQITKELCRFLTDCLIEVLYKDQTTISQKFFLFLLMGSPNQIAYNLFISEKVKDSRDDTDKTEEKQSVITRYPRYIEVFRGKKYVDLEIILDWMSLAKNVMNKDEVFFDGEECSDKTKEDFFDWLRNLICLKTKYLSLKNRDSAENLTDEEMYLLQDLEDSSTYEDVYDIFCYSASFFKNKETVQHAN